MKETKNHESGEFSVNINMTLQDIEELLHCINIDTKHCMNVEFWQFCWIFHDWDRSKIKAKSTVLIKSKNKNVL